MKPAIIVENLSKEYRVGQRLNYGYRDLRDAIVGAAKMPFRAMRSVFGKRNGASGAVKNGESDKIWALKDVSFEVQPGEVVGIIGRNGAGKSTLLKILSRITEPTTGRAVINGRIGSLLEVGTGFHPDLTGRENVYMNGTILGMRKKEIDRKFDEIVDFSGVEKFLDTPVKRYSSGMKVRLAFAVAAHLEPEILVIDEVLAVGDAEFQKKCLGKMHDVATAGRAVLFVSHNMPAVQALCTRGIVLSNGIVSIDSTTRQALDTYLLHHQESAQNENMRWTTAPLKSDVHLTGFSVYSNGRKTSAVEIGGEVRFRISYSARGYQTDCRFRVRIHDSLDQLIVKFSTDWTREYNGGIDGDGEIECVTPSLPLMPGQYRVAVAVKQRNEPAHCVENAAALEVLPADATGTGKLPDGGIIVLPGKWMCCGAASAPK